MQANICNLLTWFVEGGAVPHILFSAPRITCVVLFTKQVAEPVAEVIKESAPSAVTEPVAEAKKDGIDTTAALHHLTL